MIKRWVLCFFCLFLAFASSPTILEKLPEKTKIPIKRADFWVSYRFIMKNEGFYSFHERDKGGETYAGIARGLDYGSKWSGWRLIDEYKKYHQIKWNDSLPIPLLDWKVHDYYVSIWTSEDFMSIEDQDLANFILDTRINCTIGSQIIKKTLIEMGYPLILNNQMDSTTVYYINKAPKWEFLFRLTQNRLSFYTGIVDRHQDQLIWLNHWVKRSNIKQ